MELPWSFITKNDDDIKGSGEENNDSDDDINDSGDDINDSGDDVLPKGSLSEPIGFSITLVL